MAAEQITFVKPGALPPASLPLLPDDIVVACRGADPAAQLLLSDLIAYVIGAFIANNVREVELDFGSIGVYSGVFSIADVHMTADKKISAIQSARPSLGRDEDEAEMDRIVVSAVADNGSYRIYATAVPGPVSGKFNFNLTVT